MKCFEIHKFTMGAIFFVPAFVLLVLGGCASKTYYQISSDERWSSYGSACAGPIASYEKQIGRSVRIWLMPRRDSSGTTLNVRFLLGVDSTVRLESSSIQVSTDREADTRSASFAEITSGLQWETYPKEYWVPILKFAPLDELRGLGRFAKNPQPNARDDWYDIEVKIDPRPISWFRVTLPAMLVNGAKVVIRPVLFEYKTDSHLLCLQ